LRLPPLPDPAILRRHRGLLAAGAYALALAVFLLVAWASAAVIESRSASAVTSRLLAEGFTWATVTADGLQVQLTGTAPNEAARFRAVNLAGSIVDAARMRDGLEVRPARAIEAPRFSVEMLRNEDNIQLIGLLPEGADEARLTEAAAALVAPEGLSEMLETAAYPAPEGWDRALAFGLGALQALPRAKISVAADLVAVTAIARSDEERSAFTAALADLRPEGLRATIDISAPRPVLTPFTLRFVADAGGLRFDACSADTETAKARILAAATEAGASVDPESCIVGLGVPSPSWAAATAAGIRAVAALGEATITFSDADVTLEAGTAVPPETYDRVVGEFRAALPEVFSLDARLAEKAEAAASGPAEFTATRAPGSDRVELRGRLADERAQAAVESLASARFGGSELFPAIRLDPGLPEGWSLRVMAGIEALAELDHGRLLVRGDLVEVAGVTGSHAARGRISQILSERLGIGQTFRIDVTYDEALDPIASIPTPRECAERVDTVLAANKIRFPPGSSEIDGTASRIIGLLAQALDKCGPVRMEIGGHTDAQGSDGGNLALSQARAEAVLLALQGRQVDITGMRAKGYGETQFIAGNATEEEREMNRRIEIRLIEPLGGVGEALSPIEDTARAAASAAGTAAAPEAGTEAATGGETGAEAPSAAPQDQPDGATGTPAAAPRQRPDQKG
jgi:OOP family OmpA-OmpF porin